jgi:hypothetical protein
VWGSERTSLLTSLNSQSHKPSVFLFLAKKVRGKSEEFCLYCQVMNSVEFF